MATLSTNRVVLGRLAQVDEDLPGLLAVGTQPASLAPR